MSFASIFLIHPRTNPWNFREKILRIGGNEKLRFLSRTFWIYFCFIPMNISQSFLDTKDGLKFWWLPWFPAQSNTCTKICNTVYKYKKAVRSLTLCLYYFPFPKKTAYFMDDLLGWLDGLASSCLKLTSCQHNNEININELPPLWMI